MKYIKAYKTIALHSVSLCLCEYLLISYNLVLYCIMIQVIHILHTIDT